MTPHSLDFLTCELGTSIFLLRGLFENQQAWHKGGGHTQKLFLLSTMDKFTGSRLQQTNFKACLCDFPPVLSWETVTYLKILPTEIIPVS